MFLIESFEIDKDNAVVRGSGVIKNTGYFEGFMKIGIVSGIGMSETDHIADLDAIAFGDHVTDNGSFDLRIFEKGAFFKSIILSVRFTDITKIIRIGSDYRRAHVIIAPGNGNCVFDFRRIPACLHKIVIIIGDQSKRILIIKNST